MTRPASIHGEITRRSFLTATAGAGLLTACGVDQALPAGSPGWSFTEDRGLRVERPAPPQRIVAYDTAAAALWHLGIEPAGIFAGSALTQSVSLRGFDTARVAAVGESYGQVDLEALAALRPDLIVTAFDPRQTGPLFGFGAQAPLERAGAVAPIVAIDGIRDPVAVIERFEALARSLGAEPPDEPRARFEAASVQLRAALAAEPDLLAVAFTISEQQMYFARPARFPRTAPTGCARVAVGRAGRCGHRRQRGLSRASSGTYTADVEAILAAVRTADPSLTR